ncbi:MAG: tyrosine-type recombinase/integrase [Candidatus Coproplasma sp.]
MGNYIDKLEAALANKEAQEAKRLAEESKTVTPDNTVEEKNKTNESDIMFADYVAEWLAIKSKTTKASTYKEYERMCKRDILDEFDERTIGEMTRPIIQKYLFGIVEKGKHRTAEKISQVLTSIFDLISEDLNINSPMKRIVLPYYETKKGRAFNKEEEKRLVNFCIENKDNAAASALLVLLYFGLRKSELKTISVEDEKLTCVTSKTRLGKGEVKRTIPFTPVFKRVLEYVDFEKAKNTNVHTLETTFKRLFPERHPHELRYTFITRTKECGVAGEVVMIWAGHSYDKDVKTSAVDRGYTTYSEEFLLKEARKVDYCLN